MNYKILIGSAILAVTSAILFLFFLMMLGGEGGCAAGIATNWQNDDDKKLQVTIGCGIGIVIMLILGFIFFIASFGTCIGFIVSLIFGFTTDADDF